MKKSLKFEEAILELENITQSLERGDVPLDEALAKYEEAVKLIRQCNTMLDKAEEAVRILTESADGAVTDKQFIPDDEN